MKVCSCGLVGVLLLASGCSSFDEKEARLSAQSFIDAWQKQDIVAVRDKFYIADLEKKNARLIAEKLKFNLPDENTYWSPDGISSAEADRFAMLLVKKQVMLGESIIGIGKVVADNSTAAVEVILRVWGSPGPADQSGGSFREKRVLILRCGSSYGLEIDDSWGEWKIDVQASSFLHQGFSSGQIAGREIAPADWQDDKQPAAKGKIHHVVLCWLKEPAYDEARNKIIAVSKQFKNIPGVLNVSVGRVLPSDRPVVDDSFDVAMVMTFADEKAMNAYINHPEHEKATRDVLLPLVKKILIYDFTE